VERYLVFPVRCRHCDAPASFRFLPTDRGEVVGVYYCPDGFVSRAIHFSLEPDLEWFYDFLSGQVGRDAVERRDLRVATRHGWELGRGATDDLARISLRADNPVIREVYWTRYPKSDAERSRGIFLCSDPEHDKGCEKLFMQEITSKIRLCPECRLPLRLTCL